MEEPVGLLSMRLQELDITEWLSMPAHVSQKTRPVARSGPHTGCTGQRKYLLGKQFNYKIYYKMHDQCKLGWFISKDSKDWIEKRHWHICYSISACDGLSSVCALSFPVLVEGLSVYVCMCVCAFHCQKYNCYVTSYHLHWKKISTRSWLFGIYLH